MSVRMEYFLSSPTTRPIAIPAQAAFIGTPASMRARDPPQTVAMEEEPLDSKMSEARHIAKGKSAWGGRRVTNARCAIAPWPISGRPVHGSDFTFTTLTGGE